MAACSAAWAAATGVVTSFATVATTESGTVHHTAWVFSVRSGKSRLEWSQTAPVTASLRRYPVTRDDMRTDPTHACPAPKAAVSSTDTTAMSVLDRAWVT